MKIVGKLAVPVLSLLLAAVLSSSCGFSNAEKHFLAGVRYQKQGQMKEAIAAYNEAMRLDPDLSFDGLTYYNRGEAYRIIGKYERAIQDLDKAIKTDPEHPNFYAARALAHTALGMDDQAKGDIDWAVMLGFDRLILDGQVATIVGRR